MALPSVSAPISCTPYQRCGYSYTTVVKSKEGEEEERGMMGNIGGRGWERNKDSWQVSSVFIRQRMEQLLHVGLKDPF